MESQLTSREIDQLVAWGGKFLRTASIKSEIMELLTGVGYSDAEHKQGWDLYLRMLGYPSNPAKVPTTTAKTPNQLAALTEIDRFDEPTFRRSAAALSRLHPEQYAYIFGDGLSAKTGPESVGAVQTFLDRYAALRDGTDATRQASREADAAAAATLASRNIVTPAIEQHMRALIDIVKQAAPPRTVPSVSEESRQAAAQQFDAWLRDWRTTASAGITRRDYRIMLGISRRRTADGAPEPAPTDAPAATATTGVAHA